MVEGDNSIRQLGMARVKDIRQAGRSAIDFAGRDSKKCKLNPEGNLFSLRYQHNGDAARLQPLAAGRAAAMV
jgi:hypothetical protein